MSNDHADGPVISRPGGDGDGTDQSQNAVRSPETDDANPVPVNGSILARHAEEPEAPAPQQSARPRQMTNAKLRKIHANPVDQGKDPKIRCKEFLKCIAKRCGVPARVELDRALFYRNGSDGQNAIIAVH